MSKKQNRIRARRARQAQELLSLRAELLLLVDGAPVPNHYFELDRLQTRDLVRRYRDYVRRDYSPRPSGAIPQPPPSYQAQLDIAAKQLQEDIDKELIKSLMTPSLDT